ncbi:hypothetical protein [Eubacterium sp.]|uniref:hypothetical protein n=1 Tax=Eubacterium sp. TaxID=142586 RepID=UPI002587711B|nr:hypothetical protein [Eubacterium sp.]MCR5367151.1 hypothetical protein [Eubacterium sp.]
MLNSTICSYPDRGNKWGNNKYRGNCSGRLIMDIVKTPCYHILDKNGKAVQSLSDYMVGGGTTEDVCRDAGVPGTYLDLNRGFDMMSMEIPERPDNIFWHPPYGQMIVYSDKMYKADDIIARYGFDPRVNDLSRAKDWQDFVNKMNYCLLKQFTALKKGGRMFVLMGDWKQKGKLYSMLCDIVKLGTLEQIIIKAEHNCWSDKNTYSNMNFVPIQHEYLMVLHKDSAILIPAAVAKREEFSILEAKTSTWKDILQAILEEAGRPLSRKELYEAVNKTERAKSGENSNIEAKVRQTIGRFPKVFREISQGFYALAS